MKFWCVVVTYDKGLAEVVHLRDLPIRTDKHITGPQISFIIFLNLTVLGYIWLAADMT